MTQRNPVNRKERMLITGANGLLGREICQLFSDKYEIMPTDWEDLDVRNEKDCMRVIGAFCPDLVIHCAAYTTVDRAEEDEEAATELNAGGSRNVALSCREHGALLVTFGTDYVFDGTAKRPYAEDDPTGPLSAYGRSKLAAEEAVREVAPKYLLIRTQWLFGAHGRNFVLSVLDRADRGEKLSIVSDQIGSPTYTRDLAMAVRKLLETGARGTFHFSNEGETTFFDFAAFVLAHAGRAGTHLSAIPTSGLPKGAYPAPRPLYAVLSKEKYRKATGAAPRRWEDAVLDFLRTGNEGGGTW